MLAVGIVFAMLTPWLVRNYGQFHSGPFRLTTLEGISLYEAVYPEADGGPKQDKINKQLPPDIAVLNEAQRNDEWNRRGWEYVRTEPLRVGKLAYAKIKDWVTQTGNSFLKEPPKTVKPEGDLGADVSYTKPDFDDSAWRKLDLPHDWGIEGPFKQEYPGDTGKLPWWGVGWYRKHFNIPAEDQGQRFVLEVDGAMAYATVWLNGKNVGDVGQLKSLLENTRHWDLVIDRAGRRLSLTVDG